MKNKIFPSQSLFSLGMILVLSACTVSSPGTMEAEAPAPEMAAATPLTADEASDDTDVGNPPVPNPASIEVSLEAGSAATARLGPEGGSITTVDANGTEYTLTVPEGALFSAAEITMTPIASAEGEAIGETFLAGVALQPENLHFLELVTIEMTGDIIEEDGIGISSVEGGQDFHLTPSTFASGTMTITTTHFSEFGVSQQEVADLVQMLVPLAETARLEHALAVGDDAQILRAFERMIASLRNAGQVESFAQWEPWTANVFNLVRRYHEVRNQRGWDDNTPGLTDTFRKMQGLIEQWFQQSEGVLRALNEKCIQGKIEVIPRVKLMFGFVTAFFPILESDQEMDDVAETWMDLTTVCFACGITWQANVVTTGSEFFSDISVGSEVSNDPQIIFTDTNRLFRRTALEVEYIDGFWLDTCVPTPGSVTIELEMHWEDTDFYGGTGYISSITVFVKIDEPVYIDCSPAGFEITADAQEAFHGGALEELNKGREGGRSSLGRDRGWRYELEYDPGGGVIAQFEEGPETFSWSEGKYELWQLVTLYQTSPAE